VTLKGVEIKDWKEIQMADTYKAVETTAPGTLRIVERSIPQAGMGQVTHPRRSIRKWSLDLITEIKIYGKL